LEIRKRPKRNNPIPNVKIPACGRQANVKLMPNSIQTYLKFPLTLPLSPSGERGRVRGENVRRKFSDLNM
jgi:hypothetical protein